MTIVYCEKISHTATKPAAVLTSGIIKNITNHMIILADKFTIELQLSFRKGKFKLAINRVRKTKKNKTGNARDTLLKDPAKKIISDQPDKT